MANFPDSQAQVVLPTSDLNADISFFESLGFQLHQIFPSDDPEVAILFGHSLSLRLDRTMKCPAPILQLLTDEPEKFGITDKQVKAPNGTILRILPKTYQLHHPHTQHKFEVRRLQHNDPWVIGRAGMLYRDLIPDRLGGSIIASHIHIPEGGPVPDVVHYHTIGFQLIFCYKGWVKLVYEDQGPPFILNAGDCVTQPPEIRHRVLEASNNLEVIEIGVPSDHMTTIDHTMELPNATFNPERKFQGQKFCHHRAAEAFWGSWHIPGFEFRDTGISSATNGIASVIVIRTNAESTSTRYLNHDTDILFTFIMEGKLTLQAEGHELQILGAGDAFVLPPKHNYQMVKTSQDLELLEVALPGNYKTTVT